MRRVSGHLVGCDFARRQTQADEADFQWTELLDQIWRRAADGTARPSIDDVGHDPLPSRFLHPLNQDVVAEIEFVVAERRQVESDSVEGGHHLLALENARRDRWRQKISREHQKRRQAFGA